MRPASPLPQRRAAGMQPVPARWTSDFRAPAVPPWQMDGSTGLYSFGAAPVARGKRRQDADMVSCCPRGLCVPASSNRLHFKFSTQNHAVESSSTIAKSTLPPAALALHTCLQRRWQHQKARHCVMSSACLQVQWEMAEAFELQYISAQAG